MSFIIFTEDFSKWLRDAIKKSENISDLFSESFKKGEKEVKRRPNDCQSRICKVFLKATNIKLPPKGNKYKIATQGK